MNTTQKSRKKLKIINYSILIFMLCIILIPIGTYKYNHTFSQKRFIENPSARIDMVSDLLSKYDLVGKQRNFVTDLLGAETENAYFKKAHNIVYCIGYGFVAFDRSWLVITFLDDVVISVEILSD